MSEQPWMPLYVADYLGDTQHLSTEENGAYLLILMGMWRNGRLRNDPKILARLTRVSPRRWHLVAENVLALFKVDDNGFLYSPRLEREHQKALSFRAKQSANSKLGVAAKLLKDKEPPPANGSPTVEPNATLPQSQSHIEKEEGASALVVGFQGRVIKLNSPDYLRWKQNYPNVDLDAELSAHDAFLAGEPPEDQKRWFIRTATHLRNRNADLKAKRVNKPSVSGRLKVFAPSPPKPNLTPEQKAELDEKLARVKARLCQRRP